MIFPFLLVSSEGSLNEEGHAGSEWLHFVLLLIVIKVEVDFTSLMCLSLRKILIMG